MIFYQSAAKLTFLMVALTAPLSIRAAGDSVLDKNSLTHELKDCSGAVDLNAMNQCRESGYETAKSTVQILITDLRETYKTEEPPLYELLKTSHQAWREYIEAECDYQTYYSLGTQAETANRFRCLEVHYRSRAEYLEEKLETP